MVLILIIIIYSQLCSANLPDFTDFHVFDRQLIINIYTWLAAMTAKFRWNCWNSNNFDLELHIYIAIEWPLIWNCSFIFQFSYVNHMSHFVKGKYCNLLYLRLSGNDISFDMNSRNWLPFTFLTIMRFGRTVNIRNFTCFFRRDVLGARRPLLICKTCRSYFPNI